MLGKLRVLTRIFALAAVVYAVKNKRSHGRLLGVPFEFRVPTARRLRQRWWNPEDPRILTPQVFGVGWSLNAYQVMKRLGFVKEQPDSPEVSDQEEQ